jgi:hypothetical protein
MHTKKNGGFVNKSGRKIFKQITKYAEKKRVKIVLENCRKNVLIIQGRIGEI